MIQIPFGAFANVAVPSDVDVTVAVPQADPLNFLTAQQPFQVVVFSAPAAEGGGGGVTGPQGPAGPQGATGPAGPSNVITESSGPTALAVGEVADGEYLRRVGTTVVGATPAGGSPGGSDGQLQYKDGTAFAGAPLHRVDANTVAQHNGASAQTGQWYRTRTDASNGEWFSVRWDGAVCVLGTQANGTGVRRNISIDIGTTTVVEFTRAVDRQIRLSHNGSSGQIFEPLVRMAIVGTQGVVIGNVDGVDPTKGWHFNFGTLEVGRNVGPATVRQAALTSDLASRSLSFTAGSAWANATTNISGAPLILTGGEAASGSSGAANGGNVNLDGGRGYGTGQHGDIIIGATRGHLRLPVLTVETLPAPITGRRCFVSNANSTTFHSIVVGGGSNFVPVFADGTNWRIG